MYEERSCIIYGAGGHGKVVADAAIAAGYRVLGSIDDRAPVGTVVLAATDLELRVLGGRAWLDNRAQDSFLVGLGIGNNQVRKSVADSVIARGFALATIIHPSAVASPFAVIGNGTVVMALAVVNPSARIGAGVILNTGSVIEHDCVVDDFAHVSPNATLAGAARVGALSHVGTGAAVLPGIAVGDRCTVGAGAVVNRNVGHDQLVVGVPARALVRS